MFEAGATAHYENASVSLLAQTPSLAKNLNEPDDKQWQLTRLQLEQRLYALRSWRLSWWAHWARLAEAILPRRYHWLIAPNTMTRGLAINQAIIDPTPAQALRVCTAGMRAGLMSSSRPWFKLKAGLKNFKPDRDAQIWLEEVEARIYAVLAGSNFYTAATQMFEDLIVFGTAPFLIYEDLEDVIRCQVPVCGEYYLGNGSDFRINTFNRTFNLTTLQIVQMFGLKNVGPEVQGLWNQKGASLDQENIVAHSIAPNFGMGREGDASKLGVVKGGFPWGEYYWLWNKSTPMPLSVRGFRTKPFVVFRWATTSNDAYGRSPGMDALPDVLQLHQMTRRQAEAIEKMVRPPMQADISMKNQPSSILPGRVTYVKDVAQGGMRPIYTVDPKIEHMTALIEKIETRVQKWFFNDLFLMLENLEGIQPRNELEIAERRGEKLLVLGPVVEGVENQAAEALRRIYTIMGRRGLVPEKPQSLQGVPLEIDILSMIALAQRAAETAVMERVATVATQLSASFPDKPPLDNINGDEFLRDYADKVSFPMKVFYAPDDVDEMRAARAKAQQQAMQAEAGAAAATHVAPALASAAKDASEISLGGGLTALDLAVGNSAPQ
jgi:hypothetical protein